MVLTVAVGNFSLRALRAAMWHPYRALTTVSFSKYMWWAWINPPVHTVTEKHKIQSAVFTQKKKMVWFLAAHMSWNTIKNAECITVAKAVVCFYWEFLLFQHNYHSPHGDFLLLEEVQLCVDVGFTPGAASCIHCWYCYFQCTLSSVICKSSFNPCIR